MPKKKSAPKKTLTWLVLVVDRSGSMQDILDDAQGGINALIQEQKSVEGDCLLTLAQFDDQYEIVHLSQPLKDVPAYELKPRGWTALLDAVGKTISTVGIEYDARAEGDRPSLVYVVIATDGKENKSKEYKSAKQIRDLIDSKKKLGWQFQFLGADADAFSDAEAMGISNAAHYAKDRSGVAYATTSGSVTRARAAAAAGASEEELTRAAAYTADELRRMRGSDTK